VLGLNASLFTMWLKVIEVRSPS